jgi:hypothetical protein
MRKRYRVDGQAVHLEAVSDSESIRLELSRSSTETGVTVGSRARVAIAGSGRASSASMSAAGATSGGATATGATTAQGRRHAFKLTE